MSVFLQCWYSSGESYYKSPATKNSEAVSRILANFKHNNFNSNKMELQLNASARKPKSIAGILKDSIQPIIYAAPTRTAVAPGAVCGPSPYRGYGTSGAQQPGPPYYTDPGGPGMNPVGNSMAMAFQVPPNSPQGSVACPPPPAYCNTPPPPYEQVVKAK
ncbi:vesicular, overexpressed in cancer, prosurvival protein 1 isoform X3 [Macaca thibetana thibetana]|uniref:vesicular, overexpressed in cancer, prosurvival protein 1 isoform X3 n=1 Tax=Macaca thibetana thibetana TaxID=257877 RepID=UPI0021BC73A7|nr:vesicular, overexpressed in cancer, prosurvival protein 1 isoform X3 [Macaca thibetana thibetana]